MYSDVRVCKVEKNACKPFLDIIGRKRISDDKLHVIGVYEREAWAGILAYYEEKSVFLLNKLYLLPEFRSKGYGALLLDKLKKNAATSGVGILAKVYNANADKTENDLTYLMKNGFTTPYIKDIYFIVDVEKAFHSSTRQRFGDAEKIIDEEYTQYTYNEIKANPTLFKLLKAYSHELCALQNMEEENTHSYFFVHNNDISGWFSLELKSPGNMHVGFLFSHPQRRYRMWGFRLFKMLFDKVLEINPSTKTVSFNIDPENKRMLNVYTLIFKDSIQNIIPVWYTYCYMYGTNMNE